MTIDELIRELRLIKKVHPEAQVIESRTLLGRKGNHVAIRLKDHVVLIESVRDS